MRTGVGRPPAKCSACPWQEGYSARRWCMALVHGVGAWLAFLTFRPPCLPQTEPGSVPIAPVTKLRPSLSPQPPAPTPSLSHPELTERALRDVDCRGAESALVVPIHGAAAASVDAGGGVAGCAPGRATSELGRLPRAGLQGAEGVAGGWAGAAGEADERRWIRERWVGCHLRSRAGRGSGAPVDAVF